MELLEQIEAYLVRSSVSPSTFGRLAVGDPRFVDDLRLGRRPRRKTELRVREYLLDSGYDGPEREATDVQCHHRALTRTTQNHDFRRLAQVASD